MPLTILAATAAAIGCSLLQSTWLQAIAVLTVVPDLSLLVIVFVAFQNVRTEGIAAGFLSGLLQDFISAAPLGSTAFVRTLVSFGFNQISGSFYLDRVLMPLIFGAAATLVKALATALLAIAFPAFVRGYDFLDRVLWIEIAYNAVAAPIMFFLLGLFRSLFVTARNRQ
ncbi:MAG TPA: rod shape-determining protein MreD [Magnetospirillaceae bacterium]|nr:rod shape-determining protein MreD [Magnetospirillaceae bacterium]